MSPGGPGGPRATRLLFVHAHPDDETLATGVAIAHHARAGDDVHVLTCTLGEEGEVIPADLAHLEGTEALAPHRFSELKAALAALGARGHLLGASDDGEHPAYRDSGMAGSAAAGHPRALAGAPLAEVAAAVGGVVAELAPDVVVTYDRSGGYGHPDHVRVHEATVAALAGMADPPALYAVLTPRSWADEDRDWLASHPEQVGEWALPEGAHVPSVVDDDVVTHAVVEPDVVAVVEAALRAHATQVAVGDGCAALSNGVALRVRGREGFARLDLATGEPLPGRGDGAGRPGLTP